MEKIQTLDFPFFFWFLVTVESPYLCLDFLKALRELLCVKCVCVACIATFSKLHIQIM